MTRKQIMELALEACDNDEAILAQRLGMTNVSSAARQFARFRKGSGMNFEQTIALLRIAGLLREEPSVTSPSEEEVAAVLHLVAGFLERLAQASPSPGPHQPASENGS